ncbi:DHHC zinc finger membrane protein [Aspergillus rambellii]|uniref:Palmitoyltransferase n=1 Tax=Aspergillus rambellii TaxID=308745 RepID=A0A0F8V0A1_9EURO|nr:DHHC zinc finger membrane protein [Aspergillus rambellii]
MAFPSGNSEPNESTNPPPTAPVLGIPRPPSVGGISSRVTDMTSEDGEQSQSYTVSSQIPQSRPSVSRRVPPPARSSIASTSQTTTRPGSSGSRLSRTHIPSLAAQGFFRPMSSQRLQAHRGRPMTKGTTVSSEDWGDQASQNRRSLISNSTFPNSVHQVDQVDLEAPPSRGTEFTDPIIPDRNTSNASPIGNTTGRSLGESAKLLHDRERMYKPTPPHLNLGVNFKTTNDPETPERSPLSFLSLQNKNAPAENRDNRTHERLSSAGSSPASIEKQSHPIPKGKKGKNYEYFVGNTIFWGGGRFQNSRDKPVNIATGLFVVVPSGLFFGFSAPWLWHHISPAIPILFAYLFYLCFSSFIHASVVDPGVIPRNLHQMPPSDPSDDPLAVGPPTNDWVMVKLATSEVAAMDVPVKYCKTCSVWRPPRCYHCRVCDNCVETLDHHCVWLNNCVGRRNYRYFFTFVSTSTLLALFLLGASLAHILVYRSHEGISFGAAIDKWRVPFAMVIYGAVAAPYPASLWAYHIFLVGRGETTREYLNSHKFAKADRHRPFTQGNVFRNWMSVFGRPRPPTYMQFKEYYQEGDQRLSTIKRKYLPRDVEAQANIEMEHVPPPPPSQG